jgi:hypothetical protein
MEVWNSLEREKKGRRKKKKWKKERKEIKKKERGSGFNI